MTDQKKPEAITDEDLNDVQGGLLQFEIQMAEGGDPRQTSFYEKGNKAAGILAAGNDSPMVKKPGMNMEVVNEDE